MLYAASTVLAYRLFLLRMDRGAPWPAQTAACDALLAGAMAAAAGVALLAGVAAARLQWWQPRPDHPVALLLMLSAGAGLCCLAKRRSGQVLAELWPWLMLAGGVLLVLEAQRVSIAFAPCLLVLVVGAVLLRAGWRLAAWSAPAMLRAGSDSL
ncbi:MAG TPA: hypothetical protein VGJ35_10180 [Burkholderiaceae bacterium]|jgi:hypothetical protein